MRIKKRKFGFYAITPLWNIAVAMLAMPNRTDSFLIRAYPESED